MVIREIMEERRRKYKHNKLMKKIILVSTAMGFILRFAVLPGTEALFRNAKSDTLTCTVTENDYPVTASLVFNNSPSAVSLQSNDDIRAAVLLDEEYSAANVDLSTVQFCRDGISVPITGISVEDNALIISLSENAAESLLGFGTHIVQVDGMFNDGWMHFYAQGVLEIIDEELIAEQKAISLVEALETDASLNQEKIDSVREIVVSLRDGQVKDELLARINYIQEKMAENAAKPETTSPEAFYIEQSLNDEFQDGAVITDILNPLDPIRSESVDRSGENLTGGTDDPI